MKPDAQRAEDRLQALADLTATMQALNQQYDDLDTLVAIVTKETEAMQGECIVLRDKVKRAINLLQASNNDTF